MSQPLDLDAIRERAEAATKTDLVENHGATFRSAADVPTLIAALTDAWAEVERLRAENEEARQVLQACRYNEPLQESWDGTPHMARLDAILDPPAVSHTEKTPVFDPDDHLLGTPRGRAEWERRHGSSEETPQP